MEGKSGGYQNIYGDCFIRDCSNLRADQCPHRPDIHDSIPSQLCESQPKKVGAVFLWHFSDVSLKSERPLFARPPAYYRSGRVYGPRAATRQRATTGTDGLTAASISKTWVISGKPINPVYSGIGKPCIAPRWSISTPQGALPSLAYFVVELYETIGICRVIRTYWR